jgi:hypothetical protein
MKMFTQDRKPAYRAFSSLLKSQVFRAEVVGSAEGFDRPSPTFQFGTGWLTCWKVEFELNGGIFEWCRFECPIRSEATPVETFFRPIGFWTTFLKVEDREKQREVRIWVANIKLIGRSGLRELY